jgi:hypothetical protein
LYDNVNHYTHFTGFVLNEEIVASLWVFCFNYPKMIVNWSKKIFIVSNIWWNGIIYNQIQSS